MEKWQLSGIITSGTRNKLIIPKGYAKNAAKTNLFSKLYGFFRQGAEKLARVAAIF
ncbi:MAG: hypothetical protein KKG47_05825 [Proteobacteria bacterium]|nr:hypothetical protein [Pseudomonadota bacterium]MBU1736991.1 hypothetical protein [Pseudomonadota bacterium]